jgi:integrase
MLQTTAQLPFSAKLFSASSPPPKQPSTREREYLRSSEIKKMIRAAKKVGRHGVRDGGIILLMFRHGLRTAELVALKWTQIDLAGGYIEVHRVKHGRDSIHPLRSPEIRALRQIQRDYADTSYVFVHIQLKQPIRINMTKYQRSNRL